MPSNTAAIKHALHLLYSLLLPGVRAGLSFQHHNCTLLAIIWVKYLWARQELLPFFKQNVDLVLGVGAVLAVLQQSLAGWEALETDLLESANLTQQAAELSSRVRSATQVVVDAVLDLLDAGVFR